MKRLIIGVLGAGLVVGTALAQDTKKAAVKQAVPAKAKPAPAATAPAAAAPAANPGGPADLKTTEQRASYAQGIILGQRFKGLDADALVRGIKDALASKPGMTGQQCQEALVAYQRDMSAKLPELNKKEGDAFLAANKKKEGVKALPSGLQYKVLKEGTGKIPGPNDTVSVNYRGTLIDGTEFDSSYARGEPLELPVNGVIKGWSEALQLMKEGSKWMLYIPSDLAYGERGQGPVIGPNAALVFEVELLSINK